MGEERQSDVELHADEEWLFLILLAKTIGVSQDEVRNYLRASAGFMLPTTE